MSVYCKTYLSLANVGRGVLTFVNNIPMSALILIPPSKFLDMILHDGNQSLVVEIAFADPGGQLRMPDQSVASDFLLVLVCEIDNGICSGKGKVVAAGLGGLPFHGVFGGDGVEFVAGLDDALFDWVIADGQGCADVLASFGGPGLSESLILGRGGRSAIPG